MKVNKKIVFAGVGGVFLLLFVFAAIMLFRGIRQFGVAETNLAATRTSLDGFYRKKPFPSLDNTKKIKDNVASMDGWIRDIVDFAKRKQIDPAETRSPSVFGNMLGKVKNGLQSKAKHGGVVLSDDFGFGFDRYVAGEQAKPEHVPRLIQQLLIINDICNILIDEKTKEIHSIEREQFDGAGATVTTTATRGSRGRNRSKSRGGAAVAAGLRRASAIAASPAGDTTGEFSGDDLDSKLKFVFEFSSKEAGLFDILNKLAKNEMFIVVTSVDIEGGAEAPTKKTAATKKPSAGAASSFLFGQTTGDEAESVAKKSTYKRVPSREERVMFGGKKEQPSKVRIELEVYRFK